MHGGAEKMPSWTKLIGARPTIPLQPCCCYAVLVALLFLISHFSIVEKWVMNMRGEKALSVVVTWSWRRGIYANFWVSITTCGYLCWTCDFIGYKRRYAQIVEWTTQTLTSCGLQSKSEFVLGDASKAFQDLGCSAEADLLRTCTIKES